MSPQIYLDIRGKSIKLIKHLKPITMLSYTISGFTEMARC